MYLIINFFSLVVAIVASIYCWTMLNPFYKLISCQLFVALLAAIVSKVVLLILHYQTNHIVYNVYILVETLVLLAAVLLKVAHIKLKWLLIASICLFILYWLLLVIKHPYLFANYAAVF